MNSQCPECNSQHVYPDREMLVCAECGHEFSVANPSAVEATAEIGCRDANGQELKSGDSVVLIKDLKVKGASGTLKSGTKVRNIRVIDPVDGHNISCKIEGFGGMNLKSEFVKKF